METKKGKFNADIPGSISDLQDALKEFFLRNKLYKILLRGKGLEFEAYRRFSPDDDSSAIDWKASRRSNTILVKQYKEERDLKIVFLIDVGENMVFGSSRKLKCEYVAEIVGAFSHLIITTGDRVGYVTFSDRVHNYILPSRGTKHFHRMVDIITDPLTYEGASDIQKPLDFMLDYLGKNIASVVIISDFLSFKEQHKKDLALVASKFETLVIMVKDPLDKILPNLSSEVVIEDPKTGQQLLVNPRVAKEAYARFSLEQESKLRSTCQKNNIDFLELSTDKPFVSTLATFIKGRSKQTRAI